MASPVLVDVLPLLLLLLLLMLLRFRVVQSWTHQQGTNIYATDSSVVRLDSDQPGAIPEAMMKFESVQMLTDVTQMFAEQMAVFRSLPPSLCHLSCAANPRCLSFITEPEMVCRLFRRRGRPVVPTDDDQMELGKMMHKYRLQVALPGDFCSSDGECSGGVSGSVCHQYREVCVCGDTDDPRCAPPAPPPASVEHARSTAAPSGSSTEPDIVTVEGMGDYAGIDYQIDASTSSPSGEAWDTPQPAIANMGGDSSEVGLVTSMPAIPTEGHSPSVLVSESFTETLPVFETSVDPSSSTTAEPHTAATTKSIDRAATDPSEVTEGQSYIQPETSAPTTGDPFDTAQTNELVTSLTPTGAASAESTSDDNSNQTPSDTTYTPSSYTSTSFTDSTSTVSTSSGSITAISATDDSTSPTSSTATYPQYNMFTNITEMIKLSVSEHSEFAASSTTYQNTSSSINSNQTLSLSSSDDSPTVSTIPSHITSTALSSGQTIERSVKKKGEGKVDKSSQTVTPEYLNDTSITASDSMSSNPTERTSTLRSNSMTATTDATSSKPLSTASTQQLQTASTNSERTTSPDTPASSPWNSVTTNYPDSSSTKPSSTTDSPPETTNSKEISAFLSTEHSSLTTSLSSTAPTDYSPSAWGGQETTASGADPPQGIGMSTMETTVNDPAWNFNNDLSDGVFSDSESNDQRLTQLLSASPPESISSLVDSIHMTTPDNGQATASAISEGSVHGTEELSTEFLVTEHKTPIQSDWFAESTPSSAYAWSDGSADAVQASALSEQGSSTESPQSILSTALPASETDAPTNLFFDRQSPYQGGSENTSPVSNTENPGDSLPFRGFIADDNDPMIRTEYPTHVTEEVEPNTYYEDGVFANEITLTGAFD